MIFDKIIGVGACDSKGIMGNQGQLPWHYPEELRHFSQTIAGHPLIVGRKTFQSMPAHYFKERTTIIFTHHKPSKSPSNQLFVSSMDEFFSLPQTFQDLYLIGGAQIYTLFFQHKLIKEFILTKISKLYEGDTTLPLKWLTGWDQELIHHTPEFTIYRFTNVRKDT